MLNALNHGIVSATALTLRVFRLPGLNSAHVYALLGAPALQPLLERLGRRRAADVFRAASRRCPAYAAFLGEHGADAAAARARFGAIPETTKENYVKKYPIEARCLGGRIPARGVVIDESSGSSGPPNNWVRGRAERDSVRRLLKHGFALTYGREPVFLLNCFALGPWATGMNVSMSLVDIAMLKSIGPDKQKLENTLRTFGPRYRYLIAGYPPFVKDFIDSTDLDLAPFRLHLVVGGEGITEGLRDHFARVFQSVHSSYGASDLEINIGFETPATIAARRRCAADAALCRELFGRDEPPMLFQYNPLDYLVETNADGELVFTLLRRGNAAPKVRYNIRDVGGVVRYPDLARRLASAGHGAPALPRGLAFPILYVYGRSDLTVPFYGAKVYTADVDAVLNGDPALRAAFHSFQIRTGHDEALNETMTIALERAGAGAEPVDPAALRLALFDGLKRVNQDFREVSKMFTIERLRIEVHGPGEGPFAGRDARIKHKYIAG